MRKEGMDGCSKMGFESEKYKENGDMNSYICNEEDFKMGEEFNMQPEEVTFYMYLFSSLTKKKSEQKSLDKDIIEKPRVERKKDDK